jgi:hypothetical protein
VAPPPCIHQLALPSASCCISFLSSLASCCVLSRQPTTLQPPPSIASPNHGWLLHLPPALLSLITVAWSLLTLFHCLLYRLSWASWLAGCCIASLLSGWLLHCISSRRHLPSASNSAFHCAGASHHTPLHAIAFHASSPAACCGASPHAATTHLPESLPLIAPWPPVPLVWLVIALPLLTPPPPISRQPLPHNALLPLLMPLSTPCHHLLLL